MSCNSQTNTKAESAPRIGLYLDSVYVGRVTDIPAKARWTALVIYSDLSVEIHAGVGFLFTLRENLKVGEGHQTHVLVV